MSFEENIHKQEINLHGFSQKNQVTKQINFTDSSGEKVSFDVLVRIKQSHKKDEIETTTITEVKPGEIITAFDVYRQEQAKINVAKPEKVTP